MNNPFKAFRTEQLGDDPWKYFIQDKALQDLLSSRPLIFEGGRGSGKTMFFYCNSWLEKFKKILAEGQDIKQQFNEKNYIGFYYKVDANFITNFQGKAIEESVWDDIFSTYLNFIVAQDIIKFFEKCIELQVLENNHLADIFDYLELRLENKINNTNNAKRVIQSKIEEIVDFVNNPTDEAKPKIFHSGALTNSILSKVKEVNIFQSTHFRVFIDEFEFLTENQQKQINTLIKMSNSTIIYDIAVKTNGRKTKETLNKDELIQEKNDYKYFRPEVEIEEDDYEKLLKEICRKRFQKLYQDLCIQDIKEEWLDISYYLGEHNINDEVLLYEKHEKKAALINEVRDIIKKKIIDEKLTDEFANILTDCDILHIRVHKSLLLRDNMKPEDLVKEFQLSKNRESKRYTQWFNQGKMGALFLLSKEFKIQKQYYGFNTFVLLSSGVIRSFIELCEHSFEIATMNKFSFTKPRMITPEEQTIVAKYISSKKINILSSEKPYGKNLVQFVNTIGNIFYRIHTRANHTLSHVEQNHFFTNRLELRPDVEKIIDNALMHNVLIKKLPTKKSEESIETEDFHLNHIYCPYFNISYRTMYKIKIEPDDLEKLLLGNKPDLMRSVKKILDSMNVREKFDLDSIAVQRNLF
ncbi:MAG: hypothetical protein OEZ13_03845 [Spirochaetia bacterium]|nr:hypothetical protein [Spirochaetia bacterium]